MPDNAIHQSAPAPPPARSMGGQVGDLLLDIRQKVKRVLALNSRPSNNILTSAANAMRWPEWLEWSEMKNYRHKALERDEWGRGWTGNWIRFPCCANSNFPWTLRIILGWWPAGLDSSSSSLSCWASLFPDDGDTPNSLCGPGHIIPLQSSTTHWLSPTDLELPMQGLRYCCG